MSEPFTTMHHVLMDIADYFRERCRNAAPGSAGEKRFYVYVSAITDADRMLKEQEPRVLTLEQEPIKVERHMEETEWNVCGNCGSHVIHKWAYCPYCGKRLKWDD